MPIFIVPIAYAAPSWEILIHAADNYREFDSQKARRLKGVALAANRHQTELIAIKQALLSLTPGQEVVIATYEQSVLDALNEDESQRNQALIADIKRLSPTPPFGVAFYFFGLTRFCAVATKSNEMLPPMLSSPLGRFSALTGLGGR